MSLALLPSELLLQIATYIHTKRALRSLTLVSRHFNTLFTIPLYTHGLWTSYARLGYCAYTPQFHIAKTGNLSKMRLLISLGARMQYQSLVSVAASYGHADVVRVMVEAGANVDEIADGIGSGRRTMLHQALCEGREDVAEVLVEMGADVGRMILCTDGMTVLHKAAKMGLTRVVRLLLDKGMDVDVRDGMLQTPLHCAVQRSTAMDRNDWFSSKGGDWSGYVSNRWNDPGYEEWFGNIETVGLLLAVGASRVSYDKFGRRPKDLARNHPCPKVDLWLRDGYRVITVQEYSVERHMRARRQVLKEKAGSATEHGERGCPTAPDYTFCKMERNTGQRPEFEQRQRVGTGTIRQRPLMNNI